MRKTVVSPAHRRAAAQHVVAAGMCSQRAACQILRLARSTYGYRRRTPTPVEQRLRHRLHEFALKHPRYGYRRIAALLRQEGWRAGKRHIQRLRRAEGLRVPPSRRKLIRRGISTGRPIKAMHRGHVWTWDFVADATVRGGAFRLDRPISIH
jgi:putative transposase